MKFYDLVVVVRESLALITTREQLPIEGAVESLPIRCAWAHAVLIPDDETARDFGLH
jgi:hypothetical protein